MWEYVPRKKDRKHKHKFNIAVHEGKYQVKAPTTSKDKNKNYKVER